ncbi:MAG: cell envelope integrity protein CreD [Rhodomicrobium sp.]|nr:cell envelope integrity protein CreD [Rhodomicrobium sp.]
MKLLYAEDGFVASSGFLVGIFRSPSFKFVLVGFLVLLLSAPLAIVWLLVGERQGRANSVQAEVARDWGGPQRILGPYLIVPYTVKVKRFPLPDLSLAEPDATAAVRWQDAFLALGVSDVSGLKNNVQLETSGGQKIDFEPGTGAPESARRIYGIHARLKSLASDGQAFNGGHPLRYKIDLVLNGSSSLKFAPAGRDSSISVTSNWPHPGFTGFLPVSRSITGDGFSSSWRVPHLARDVPQAWAEDGRQFALDRFGGKDAGVNLFVPVDLYSLAERALKYGFLFVAAAFGGVFVLELLSARRVHPIQYLFAGLTMVTFYVLLLSLSEHIGFPLAYLTASVATGSMISIYVGKALRSLGRGLTMLGIFNILYGLLYLILQLEDYALLAGAIAAFILLTATMFATLRVNWSGEESRPNPI